MYYRQTAAFRAFNGLQYICEGFDRVSKELYIASSAWRLADVVWQEEWSVRTTMENGTTHQFDNDVVIIGVSIGNHSITPHVVKKIGFDCALEDKDFSCQFLHIYVIFNSIYDMLSGPSSMACLHSHNMLRNNYYPLTLILHLHER